MAAALDLVLLARLLAAFGATQLLLWAAARGLGRRLERGVVLAAWLLPLALLAHPWLGGERLLAPTDILVDIFPGAPTDVDADTTHLLLNDAVHQFLPWEAEVRRAWAEGRVPLWSQRLEGGSSPWINPQARTISPLAMVARIALPLEHFLLAGLALTMLTAFQGAFLLARRLGARRSTAYLVAAFFTLGGGVQAFGLYPLAMVAAWTPWAALGLVEMARARRSTRARGVTTALLLVAVVISGHPEVAAGALALAVFLAFGLRRRGAGARQRLQQAATACLLGALLGAVSWLPFLLAAPESQRAREALFGDRAPIEYQAGFGRVEALRVVANPAAFGRPFREPWQGYSWVETAAGYPGLAVLALAAAGLAVGGGRRRPMRVLAIFFLLTQAIISLFQPVAMLLDGIPPLRVLLNSRCLPAGLLALALVAGLGLESLLRGGRRGAVRVLLALAATLTASLLIRVDGEILALWGVVLAGTLAAARGHRRAALALLVLALAVDLGPRARHALPRGLPELFYPSTPVLERVAKELERVGGEGWRVVGKGFAVYPSTLSPLGFADPRPHNAMAPWSQVQALRIFDFGDTYFSPFRNVEHPLLDFLAVRVVISQLPMPGAKRLQRFVPGVEGAVLLRNPGAQPLFFAARSAERVTSADLPAWLETLSDGAQVALPAEDGTWLPPPLEEGTTVDFEELRDGRWRLAINAPGEILLAASQPFPEGWHAVDLDGGEQLERLVVNGGFTGWRVPEGTRRIEASFRPPGLVVGAWLSLLGGLGWIGWWGLERRRGDPGARR